ncbi:hypothetical protein [Patulibacter minatonensis]|uniref:hypothetical protein n=1 Tax=Patulibacter minatonensis TaxID=298163 RepID=UPI000687DB9E|nr:hypothetical protein [Patulibacter minatonensis]
MGGGPGPALARVVLLALGLLVGIGVVFAGLAGAFFASGCIAGCDSGGSDAPSVAIVVVALAVAGLVWWGGVRVWRAFGDRVHGSGLTPRPLLLLPALPVWAASVLAAVLQ